MYLVHWRIFLAGAYLFKIFTKLASACRKKCTALSANEHTTLWNACRQEVWPMWDRCLMSVKSIVLSQQNSNYKNALDPKKTRTFKYKCTTMLNSYICIRKYFKIRRCSRQDCNSLHEVLQAKYNPLKHFYYKRGNVPLLIQGLLSPGPLRHLGYNSLCPSCMFVTWFRMETHFSRTKSPFPFVKGAQGGCDRSAEDAH